MSKEEINSEETDEQYNIIEASDMPEEVMETLKKGAQLREDLATRLGNLKDILNNIEKRSTEAPAISHEAQTDLSLFQVEKSVMILIQISKDAQSIRAYDHPNIEVNKSAEEVITKVLKIYSGVVDKLGR